MIDHAKQLAYATRPPSLTVYTASLESDVPPIAAGAVIKNCVATLISGQLSAPPGDRSPLRVGQRETIQIVTQIQFDLQ